jgi:fructose-1,6-bisphosphatase/inositol monophosphatase family enzyme
MSNNQHFREETLDFFLEQAPIMGGIALSHYGNLSDDDVEDKEGHLHDPVIIADREISDYIVPLVSRVYGDRVALLTEESAKGFGYSQQQLVQMGKPVLIVDELDGSKNFKEGKEHFSVLFGLAEKTVNGYQMTVGLVYKLLTGEVYFATIDSDAKYRNREGAEDNLVVSDRDKLIVGESPVNVAVGRKTFPVDYPAEYYRVTEAVERFREAHRQQVDSYSKFSCGLEVMDVVRGDVDAFLCAKAANWDYAGASLILRQAGGEAYLAKSLGMLTSPQPWSLQLDMPGAYYPSFFTNKAIDQDLFMHLKEHLPK